jgi:NADH:ubiquinone oxidoreductase subunit H
MRRDQWESLGWLAVIAFGLAAVIIQGVLGCR